MLNDLGEEVVVRPNIVRGEGNQVETREAVFGQLQCLIEQLVPRDSMLINKRSY